MKRRMRNSRPSTTEEMVQVIKDVWMSITPETIHNLVASLPRRIQAVIDAEGDSTKYSFLTKIEFPTGKHILFHYFEMTVVPIYLQKLYSNGNSFRKDQLNFVVDRKGSYKCFLQLETSAFYLKLSFCNQRFVYYCDIPIF